MILLTRLLLCAAALVFPFSVAVTNVFLGGVLVFGILFGFWWQGAKQCVINHKLFTVVFCAYLALSLVGLIWSLDMRWGLHVLGRQWFWLLLPIVVAILADEQWRKHFLFSLSLGLALNLVYCVLQMFGYVEVTTAGSNAEDATGHIGHIGFGLVYGVWAAWLLYLGLVWSGKQRLLVWGMAAWSYVMIFSAQGRSGYLIAVVLMLCVLLKWAFDSRNWRRALAIMAGWLILILIVVGMGPGKERLQGTWLAFTQSQYEEGLNALDSSDNAILATEERFNMWQTSIDIWRLYPNFGVGTGGLPQAVADLKEQGASSSVFTFTHPHNQYLLNLIRWGPAGLLVLLAFLFVWVRLGLTINWGRSYTAPLFTLSGLALALHALSSASMEEHFSAILAVLLLGVAMSDDRTRDEAGEK